MPQKALNTYTREYVRAQLQGKTLQEELDWLNALLAREEAEMHKHGSAIEWERKGLGLPPDVNPADIIAGIERKMNKPEKQPMGSVLKFPKESSDASKPKAGKRSTRRRRGRRTMRKR